MKGEYRYRIQLKTDAKPFALSSPRRVAAPLLPKVKQELERMMEMGVISKVTKPTEWCAGMVVVPKNDGNIRICVDLTRLNEKVLRERHILPSVEQTLAQLGNAKVFSKLDANSGFWQIKLASESALLTTFITPYGRFCFNRLPFGISSAPEYFQKQMSELLSDLEGVVCMVDDVLVHGTTQAEHDRHLDAVLKRLKEGNVTLNTAKCQFSRTSVRFLGQLLTSEGIRPDPEKVQAIQQMKQPASIPDVRRFLGMANQLGKLTPELAEKAKPLRDLLSKKNHWVWDDQQQQSFEEVKLILSSCPTLALYDPERETTVSADASSYGVGGVLRQKQPEGEWKPIAYASRALSSTEQRYAQIEKEALAVTWACEHFSHYLIGMHFGIYTDHKPLVPLLGSKNLGELPIRIQRFKMRLMRFTFNISHVAGKDLVTADTLSRAPSRQSTEEDKNSEKEADAYVRLVIQSLPSTEKRLQEIKALQEEDEVCKQLIRYCKEGWPERSNLKGAVKPYFSVASELTAQEGMLVRGSRIVVPTTLRLEMLDRLHAGHQGITKCRERAQQSMWWPGLNKQLESLIQSCSKCCKDRIQHAEPLSPSVLPTLPWQKVASDLFVWRGKKYLLVIDYFSRYIEIAKLSGESSQETIQHLKSIFARHGIPQQLVSDNGPQYSSAEFSRFTREYEFSHITSSPRYPQGNGEAERAVRTIKGMLGKVDDPSLALLTYRTTPLQNGYTPAELLMNRRLRSPLPMITKKLMSRVPHYMSLSEKEEEMKRKLKTNFDAHHKARALKPLSMGDQVWIPNHQSEGIVTRQTNPRSYEVTTHSGVLRRNRRHLNLLPQDPPVVDESDKDPPATDESENGPQSVEDEPTEVLHPADTTTGSPLPNPATGTRTRSGRVSRAPDRLDPSFN